MFFSVILPLTPSLFLSSVLTPAHNLLQPDSSSFLPRKSIGNKWQNASLSTPTLPLSPRAISGDTMENRKKGQNILYYQYTSATPTKMSTLLHVIQCSGLDLGLTTAVFIYGCHRCSYRMEIIWNNIISEVCPTNFISAILFTDIQIFGQHLQRWHFFH